MQNFNNEWFIRLTDESMEWVNREGTANFPILAPGAPDVERWLWDGYRNETEPGALVSRKTNILCLVPRTASLLLERK